MSGRHEVDNRTISFVAPIDTYFFYRTNKRSFIRFYCLFLFIRAVHSLLVLEYCSVLCRITTITLESMLVPQQECKNGSEMQTRYTSISHSSAYSNVVEVGEVEDGDGTADDAVGAPSWLDNRERTSPVVERMLAGRTKADSTEAVAVVVNKLELAVAVHHCEASELRHLTQSGPAFVPPFQVSFLCFQGALAFVLPCELSFLTRKLSALTSCFLS